MLIHFIIKCPFSSKSNAILTPQKDKLLLDISPREFLAPQEQFNVIILFYTFTKSSVWLFFLACEDSEHFWASVATAVRVVCPFLLAGRSLPAFLSLPMAGPLWRYSRVHIRYHQEASSVPRYFVGLEEIHCCVLWELFERWISAETAVASSLPTLLRLFHNYGLAIKTLYLDSSPLSLTLFVSRFLSQFPENQYERLERCYAAGVLFRTRIIFS